MSYIVLVVLSLLWLGFFLPSLLQARRTQSPLNSASTFQDSLTRISRGKVVLPEDAAQASRRGPRRSRREIARQRDVLAALAASFIASAVLGLAFGGAVRWLVVPTSIALIGYVVALRIQAEQRRAPRARRRVPAPRTYAAPPPPPAADGVVPSVGRRSAVEAARELERIAG